VWLWPVHAQETLPDEVVQFIEQRTLCDHFRAEPWPEGEALEEREQRAFLTVQMERYCKGTDEMLRVLMERYSGNRGVLQELGRFETSIEVK
jgi:hypothetical protein